VLAAGLGSAVHAATGGVPRRINLLCGRLLLLGAIEGRERLAEEDVAAVVADLCAEGLEPEVGAGGEATHSPGNGTGNGLAARLDELEALVRETQSAMAALARRGGGDGVAPG
jgi:hypothetical protein